MALRTYTDQQAAEVMAMAARGDKLTDISQALGLTYYVVRTIMHKNGMFRYRRFTAEEDATLQQMFAEYYSAEEIGLTIGRDPGTVRQRFLKLELNRPRTGSQYRTIAFLPPEIIAKLRTGDVASFDTAVDAYRQEQAEQRRIKREAEEAYRKTLATELIAKHDAAAMPRNMQIAFKRIAGLHLEEIATEYGVTRERVRQICEALIRSKDEAAT